MIVVTTDSLPGHRVRTVLGEVLGVRSIDVRAGVSVSGAFKRQDKELPDLTAVLFRIRREAIARMVAEAQQRGANAVVGLRFDSTVGADQREVAAYGTAVVVEPADEPVG
jgi:uncharacterized protein YbjQ (UPF0145 family)